MDARQAGVEPELIVREGDPVNEILAQVREDPEVGILVLGAGSEKNGPGPLVTQLSKNSGSLPIPVTIVPGGYEQGTAGEHQLGCYG